MATQRRSILVPPLAALLLASATVQPARVLHVRGTVMDDSTGAPLEAAQVWVDGTGSGTLTGGDGRYALDLDQDRLPGNPRLVAVLIGYARGEATLPGVGTAAPDTLTLDFRLVQRVIWLDEIVVTGTATPVYRRAMRSSVSNLAVAEATAGAPPPPAPSLAPTARLERPATGFDREQYAHVAENPFRSVRDEPLSTFSADVDRASYSNVRRYLLREGSLPPADAVQIEEMVNYFTYDYALPRGEHPVAVTSEVGSAPWAPAHRLLRVGVASRAVPTADLPPASLVFLLDVSGSMADPDKLPLVQASMRLLVDQLRPEDQVAIVVYAGAAGLVLEPTSGAHRARILDAIDQLHAGGSTAGGEGLRLAYEVAREHFLLEGNNRVILATDGDFNVGESSDAAMIRLIEERRAQGTFLTVLGFGTGNLQSEKMQSLAQHGNGNYAYIDGLLEARKVLVGEMGGTLLTVAKDVKLQVEFNPARVQAYRLLGYENRLLEARDFNDDAKDAGDMGAGHTVTALYEIVPVGAEDAPEIPGVDPLRYQASPREGDAPEAFDDELAFVKVRYKEPRGTRSRLLRHAVGDAGGAPSDDLAFAAAVAGFGMLLRGSPHCGDLTADRVLSLASAALGDDPGEHRRGFLEMVRAYRRITDRAGPQEILR